MISLPWHNIFNNILYFQDYEYVDKVLQDQFYDQAPAIEIIINSNKCTNPAGKYLCIYAR